MPRFIISLNEALNEINFVWFVMNLLTRLMCWFKQSKYECLESVERDFEIHIYKFLQFSYTKRNFQKRKFHRSFNHPVESFILFVWMLSLTSKHFHPLLRYIVIFLEKLWVRIRCIVSQQKLVISHKYTIVET